MISDWRPKPGRGSIIENKINGGSEHPPSHRGIITLDRDMKAGESFRFNIWMAEREDGFWQMKVKITRPPKKPTEYVRRINRDEDIPY